MSLDLPAFLQNHEDFIQFTHLMAFAGIGVVAWMVGGVSDARRHWRWLAGYGWLTALHQAIVLAGGALESPPALGAVAQLMLVLAQFSLLQFGRDAFSEGTRKKILWLALGALMAGEIGALAGVTPLDVSARYLFGMGGGFLASWALHCEARRRDLPRPGRYRAASIALLAYTAFSLVQVPTTIWPPGSIINFDVFRSASGFSAQGPLAVIAVLFALTFAHALVANIRWPEEKQERVTGRLLPACAAVLGLIAVAGAVLTEVSGHYTAASNRRDLLARALTASVQISPDELGALHGSAGDEAKPEFAKIKQKLKALHDINPDCRFVYLMAMRGTDAVFLVDAELPQSKDYSPPGQVYSEASDELRASFTNAKPFTEGPMSDRWGVWITALAPVRDCNGHLLAMLGMDVAGANWLREIRVSRMYGIAITGVLALLTMVFFGTLYMFAATAARQTETERRFRMIFQNAPEAIFVLNPETGAIVAANPRLMAWLGYEEDALLALTFADWLVPHGDGSVDLPVHLLPPRTPFHFRLPLSHAHRRAARRRDHRIALHLSRQESPARLRARRHRKTQGRGRTAPERKSLSRRRRTNQRCDFPDRPGRQMDIPESVVDTHDGPAGPGVSRHELRRIRPLR